MNTNNLYEHWLVFFYYYALLGNSVQTALDKASQQVGFQNFASTPLASGTYSTYGPYQPTAGWYSGQMHVLGNPTGTYLPSV
jgi:hypothetical protein